MRWRIERDYLEFKQEPSLGHYEGRNWRGFHHHASSCIAAYGFLMLERLSGQMENKIRAGGADRLTHGLRIADIVLNLRFNPQLFEQAWVCGGLQGKAVHARSEMKEPRGEPGALKAGMSRKPHPLLPKQTSEHWAYQTFQGARPSCQSLFKNVNSWKVSIGCQKLSCL